MNVLRLAFGIVITVLAGAWLWWGPRDVDDSMRFMPAVAGNYKLLIVTGSLLVGGFGIFLIANSV